VRRTLLLLIVFALAFGAPAPTRAQEPSPGSSATATTSVGELPPAHIIPRPNSGAAPQEPGDRGGALQLGLLALVVAVIGGAVTNLVRQSRRARAGRT